MVALAAENTKSSAYLAIILRDRPRLNKGTIMLKSSRYNFEFSYEGRKFLYNILTTSLIERTEDILADGIRNPSSDVAQSLISNGFLANDNSDEQLKYGYYFDAIRFGSASRNLKVTLIPTYSCNLACPYCYQGQDKRIEKMDFSGVERVLHFLDFVAMEGKNTDAISKVSISLYGGEPMMDKEALEIFCAGAYTIASGYELPISFDMTTNLTLLDDKMIAMIRKYKIAIQVTIDGPKYYHDKKRIYRNKLGTFDDIIKNLQRLKENGLSNLVTIRINIDKDTIDYAEAAFMSVNDYSPNIYFSVVRHYKGANDCHKGFCVPEDLYSSFTTRTNEILKKHERPVYRQFGKRTPCTLATPNKYYIDCKFDVYGCDSLVNHPECRIGTLDKDGRLNLSNFYYRQMATTAIRTVKCQGCKWMPMCGGGCPAEAYINSGRNDGNLECQCVVDEKSLTDYLIDYVKRLEIQ